MVIEMAHKCADCAYLKKRHKFIGKKEYFHKCLESKDYMTLADTKVLHDCRMFIRSDQLLELNSKLLIQRLIDAEKDKNKKRQLRRRLLAQAKDERILRKKREREQQRIQKQLELNRKRGEEEKRKEEEAKKRLEETQRKEKAEIKQKADKEKREEENLKRWRKKMKDRWKR